MSAPSIPQPSLPEIGSRAGAIPSTLPLLVGLVDELAPVLALIWVIALGLLLATGWPAWVVFALWGSVTAIMLWPVGHRLGLPYRSYRRPLFVLGVLSMAALPLLGIALDLLPANTKAAPNLSRTVALLVAVAVLTGFSVAAAAPAAVGRTMPMFFRPDLLFGDGRVLATGIISLGLSFRFLLGMVPEAPPHLPAPNGSWWGLAFAIAFGLIQTIPLRGLLKVRMRLGRLISGRWTSWWATVAKELYLVLASLAVLYGFHNVFMGRRPILDPSLLGLEPRSFASAGLPGLISLLLAAAFLILVRGGYKRGIGDPFLQETLPQTVVKDLLFLVGYVWLFYSWGTIMTGRPFLATPLVNPQPEPLLVGGLLFLWGLILLGPIRVWAQRNQRLALVGQMAAVLLPSLPGDLQRRVLLRVMEGLTRCSADDRVAYLRAMLGGLEQVDAETRAATAKLRMECLGQLAPAERRLLMLAMDEAMSRSG
jgi:hypothetical protein